MRGTVWTHREAGGLYVWADTAAGDREAFVNVLNGRVWSGKPAPEDRPFFECLGDRLTDTIAARFTR